MNDKGLSNTCYMCRRQSTSREHVPPLCLFPEKKDFQDDPDYRKNLITIPSCDKHNLKKTSDDEYLLSVLTTHIDNNPVGVRLFNSKVVRALERRPWNLFKFYRDPFRLTVGDQSTPGFMVDRKRIDRSINRITRGIFFHHFQKKALGTALIVPSSIAARPDKKGIITNRHIFQYRQWSQDVWSIADRYGENQDIFYYQVFRFEDYERTAIRLVFYEGVVFDVLIEDYKSWIRSVFTRSRLFWDSKREQKQIV